MGVVQFCLFLSCGSVSQSSCLFECVYLLGHFVGLLLLALLYSFCNLSNLRRVLLLFSSLRCVNFLLNILLFWFLFLGFSWVVDKGQGGVSVWENPLGTDQKRHQSPSNNRRLHLMFALEPKAETGQGHNSLVSLRNWCLLYHFLSLMNQIVHLTERVAPKVSLLFHG